MKRSEVIKFTKTFLLFAAIFLILCLTSCSSSAGKTEITSVNLDVREKSGNIVCKLIIDGTVADTFAQRNKGNIYLFRITPDNAQKAVLTLDGLEPVGQKKIKSGKISFSVPLSGRGDIGLVSSYLLASLGDDGKYTPLTSATHLSNPEALAIRKDGYPESYSVKGLCSESGDISDMVHCGVRHTVVTLKASDIAAGRLSDTDGAVRAYTNAGINVFLRLIPDLSSHNALYSAFLFAAERYAGIDTSYGRVSSFILGDKLNEEEFTDEQRYLFDTEKAARLAFTALRSVYSEGRMYISLGDGWESGRISSRRFISLYDTFAKAGGDYDWSVALRASLTIAIGQSVPAATKAVLDNRRIPFGEFDDIFGFMSGTTYKYRAEKNRHLLIDGGSITTTGRDSESTQNRASAFAEGIIYAEDKGLDALIYSGDIHADADIYRAFSEVDVEGACAEGGDLSFVRGMLKEQFSVVYAKLNGPVFFRDVSNGKVFRPNYEKNGHTVTPLINFDGGIPENVCPLYPNDLLKSVLSSDFSEYNSSDSDADSNGNVAKDLSCLLRSEDGKPVGMRIKNIPAKSLLKNNALTISLRVLGEKDCRIAIHIEEDLTHNSFFAEARAKTGVYGSVSFDISDFAASLDKSANVDITLTLSSDSDASFGIDSVSAVKVVGKFSGNIGFILTVVILVLILLALIVEIFRQIFKKKPKYDISDERSRGA